MNSNLLRWLWRTSRPYRLQALVNLTLGILTVLCDLAFVWATKLTVDVATSARADVSLSTTWLLLFGVVALQLMLGVMSKWVRALLGVRAQNRMQQGLYTRLSQCRWREMKAYHSGALVNRLERDVADIVTFITETLPSLCSTCLQLLGAFLLLLSMQPMLALSILLLLPLFLLLSRLYVGRMRSLTRRLRSQESRIQSYLQETLQHIVLLKTLIPEREGTARLQRLHTELQHTALHRARYSTLSATLLNLGFALGYLLTFIWGTRCLAAGTITYGAMLAFIQLVGQIQGPVRTLTKYIPTFISAATAASRLQEIELIPLEERSRTYQGKSQGGFQGKLLFDVGAGHQASAGVGLRLSHVSYSYSPSSRLVLQDFSAHFPPGSITAVTGTTGTGKTTLLRTLLALVTPTSGRATLYMRQSEQSIPTVSQRESESERPLSPDTRRFFAYVPQGNTLLSGTLRSNLLLAAPHATTEQLCQALRLAEAHFVFQLPEGLDTPCGEMGDGLSEGQAQRVCIARALLSPAPVLLLDEATSALDETTERLLLSNLTHSLQGRTIIFITHRPEALKYCTAVIRLQR